MTRSACVMPQPASPAVSSSAAIPFPRIVTSPLRRFSADAPAAPAARGFRTPEGSLALDTAIHGFDCRHTRHCRLAVFSRSSLGRSERRSTLFPAGPYHRQNGDRYDVVFKVLRADPRPFELLRNEVLQELDRLLERRGWRIQIEELHPVADERLAEHRRRHGAGRRPGDATVLIAGLLDRAPPRIFPRTIPRGFSRGSFRRSRRNLLIAPGRAGSRSRARSGGHRDAAGGPSRSSSASARWSAMGMPIGPSGHNSHATEQNATRPAPLPTRREKASAAWVVSQFEVWSGDLAQRRPQENQRGSKAECGANGMEPSPFFNEPAGFRPGG